MTKTALDFFAENIAVVYMKFGDKIIDLDEFSDKYQEIFEQAKQMEKEQLHKCASFWRGNENEIEKPIFEQYYNETYGSKGSDEHHEDNLGEIISKAHTNITKRKGKEYAPTSNEIQAEIEKLEKE